MPQIAQQDYKVIAPKYGRDFGNDAAALGELRRSILNGIGFDCLIKDTLSREGDISKVLAFYSVGNLVAVYSVANTEIENYEIPYSVEQYEGLSAIQLAEDEHRGRIENYLPTLEDAGHLMVSDNGDAICVDGKYLTVTADPVTSHIKALAIAENGPSDDNFINITWEDAQKLIGLPLAS